MTTPPAATVPAGRSGTRALLAVARSGLQSVLVHRLRSATTVACVVAVLLPYVAALGVSRGLLDQARAAARFGADLVVNGRRLGRPSPVPLAAADDVRRVPGVVEVVPRIVGEVRLGVASESAVLVGVPAASLPPHVRVVEGRLFRPGAGRELVVGSALARRLGLSPGSKVLPWYRNREGERVSTVVGVFHADLPVWESDLVLASFETAAETFDARGLATSLLVRCESGRADEVRRALARWEALGPADVDAPVRPSVVSREDLEALLPRGVLHHEGVFDLHFLLAFAVGIPLVLLTSGAGLSERRRETGLLKATGWQTDEVLLRAGVESLALALAAASAAVLLAVLWLGPLRGVGIASVLLPGVAPVPEVDVPFRLAPVPVLLAFLVSLVVVLVGSIGSAWRASAAPPAEAMR